MDTEKSTETIAVTPTTKRQLKELIQYGETMDGIINKLLIHYHKANNRNSKGRFAKLHLEGK